jgi:hypothetical protein
MEPNISKIAMAFFMFKGYVWPPNKPKWSMMVEIKICPAIIEKKQRLRHF